ncbi:hypothetical protein HaLaN_18698, partial [Haematococcus lacustris]
MASRLRRACLANLGRGVPGALLHLLVVCSLCARQQAESICDSLDAYYTNNGTTVAQCCISTAQCLAPTCSSNSMGSGASMNSSAESCTLLVPACNASRSNCLGFISCLTGPACGRAAQMCVASATGADVSDCSQGGFMMLSPLQGQGKGQPGSFNAHGALTTLASASLQVCTSRYPQVAVGVFVAQQPPSIVATPPQSSLPPPPPPSIPPPSPP